MIDTVFFDLGNTIIDYHKGILTDVEKDEEGLKNMLTYLSGRGVDISFDFLYSNFYKPWTDNLFPKREIRTREFDVTEILYSVIKNDDVDYNLLIDIFHEPSRNYAVEMRDIRETLAIMKNNKIKIGIISNTPIPGSCHIKTLRKLKLNEYFDFQIYSYDVDIRKPHRDIFNLALQCSKSEYSKMMMIGDNYKADIETPMKLGMKTFLFNSKKGFPHVNSITDFCEILPELDIS